MRAKYFLRQLWWGFCSKDKPLKLDFLFSYVWMGSRKHDPDRVWMWPRLQGFSLYATISSPRQWGSGILEIREEDLCLPKAGYEMVQTSVLSPATHQILCAFEIQLIIRISMPCPHFCSCQSSQKHTLHGAFLIAFNISLVPSSLPSTHQIHSTSNLSFNWHEVACPLAGRELQCLMAVSYFWAWSSRSALKLIKSVSVSFNDFCWPQRIILGL